MSEVSTLWASPWRRIYSACLKSQLDTAPKPRLKPGNRLRGPFDALPPKSPTRLVPDGSGEVMRIKVGSIPVCAILLIAAAGVGADAAFAQAQDACLKAPNAPAPPGSHWYYRTDHSTQSKCWSIKPAGPAAQSAAVQVQPAPATTAPAAAAPRLAAPDSSTWTLTSQQPDAATMAWPAAPPLPASPDTATPEGMLPMSPDQSAAPPAPAAPQAPATETTQPNTPLPRTPATPAADQPTTQSAAKPAAEPVKPAVSVQKRLPLAMLLAGLIGLLAIGMLLRSVVIRTLGRRPGIKIARREPRLSRAVKRPHPAVLRHSPSLVPGPAETEHRISEVEDALRHFAQRLRRRRSASPGSIPNISRSGARARS